MEYKVTIEERISEEFTIKANSEEEAKEIAEKMYKKGLIVLEPGNLLSVEFSV